MMMTLETLTLAEIEARYPREWVVLSDPELDDHLEVVRGTVVAHGSDPDEVYGQAAQLHVKHEAYFYTGPAAEDLTFLL